MTRIAFIGAGSVVFTKNLLGDILDFPALHEVRDRAARHRPRSARDRRGDGALCRGCPGREPDDHDAPRPARRDRRRRLRAQHGADRRPRGDAARLRDPGALRAAADDRRHARHRRHLPDAAHGRRTCSRSGNEMAELCPRGVAPELHEPDGDALPARLPGHADEEGRRALPLGAGHRPRSLRSSSASRGRGHVPLRGDQPPGVPPPLRARRRVALSRASTSGSPPIPSCSAASASRSTAASATSRPSRASTPPSTCRGSCATTTSSSATASRSTSTSAAARTTWSSSSA